MNFGLSGIPSVRYTTERQHEVRKLLASIIATVAVVAAVYVGLGLMFIGGIAQVVDAVQEDPVKGTEVAWGVVRITFAGFATAITLYFIGFLAFLVAGVDRSKHNRKSYRTGVLR